MRTTDALGELRRLGRPVLERSEVIARLGVTPTRASQILRSLEKAGLVVRLGHRLWLLDPSVNPLAIPPYLTAPFPAYVSLWSALRQHGMIEQIPRRIYVASLDRPRTVRTPVGTYSIHHLAPEVFGGYSGSVDAGYVAMPEKALFDIVYLRAARGGSAYLPEIELPSTFDRSGVDEWVDRIPATRLKSIVARELDAIVSRSQEETA